jgi:choline dehydrogenase-like flavoprotein
MTEPDIIIVGTGPAGVSAAYPLVEAGFQVLLIDGGRQVPEIEPRGSFVNFRANSISQWKFFLGRNLAALAVAGSNSPKLRAATMAPVFDGFAGAFPAELDNFKLIGSLASGGLSNAWGAGVATYDNDDLFGFPITATDLAPSYNVIASRIGISGAADDDLRDVFGPMAPLQPPPALDQNAQILIDRYIKDPKSARRRGLKFGIARNAVLTKALNGREPCDRSTFCLWGCEKRAIYSARFDVERLLAMPNCSKLDATVTKLSRVGSQFRIDARSARDGLPISMTAAKVILACGAIGSAKLAFELIGHRNQAVRLLSTPSAAFAILLPQQLGCPVEARGFGLAQLSFSVDMKNGVSGPAFGNIFGTSGLPMFEFARIAPLSRFAAQRLFQTLLPAMLVGNCFLPAEHSAHSLSLREDGTLLISGGYHADSDKRFEDIRARLSRCLWRYGLVLLPGSFSRSEPGSDAHYAGTVPMKADPATHESNRDGEISGAPGLYVVDGAALTRLPAKAHTFTIMANADRIARNLSRRMRQN